MKSFLNTEWFWLAAMTAVIWGFTAPLEKLGLKKVDPVTGIVARCLGAVIGIIVISALKPAVWGNLKAAGWAPVLALVAAGICGTVLGQFTNLHALKIGEISRVSSIAGSWPLIAFIVAVFLFREKVTVEKVMGVISIVGGIVLLRL